MNRRELKLLLEGRRDLTRRDALLLQRIGRLYRFGAAPIR
jgi:hypothetical protein